MTNLTPHLASQEQAKLLDAYIARIANGDRDALAGLYQETSPSVYAFSLAILKNPQDAEDVLQDCYLQIFGAAGSYHSHRKPMAWILTIARNLCMSTLRERSKTAPMTDTDWDSAFGSCEMNVDDKVVLQQCMTALDDRSRQIVALHAVAGLKHREIAALLQIPLATVLSKYARSIKKLKEELERSAVL